MLVDSVLVKRKFERSTKTYDDNAFAQRKIAFQLSLLIPDWYSANPSVVMEIGCGTGLLTRRLAAMFPRAAFCLNDINDKIEEILPQLFPRGNYIFLSGDAQLTEFPSNVSLVLSSSVIQWFDNLHIFSDKIYRSLANGGYAFISTFGRNNLKEVKSLTGEGLDYKPAKELKSLFAERFKVCRIFEDEIVINFATPIEVLKHLNRTGVNAGFATMATRSAIAAFCEQYKSLYSAEGGVKLTYNPIYLVLQKEKL
jgi:malonyl-CoA O-methyltransferase